MAAKYWLKLYHEMIDDPKVARLPDSSYRRFIECLLLAGETDEDGFLPDIETMAWRLRIDERTLKDDMSRLALAGLVELAEDGRWLVSSFSKRQKGLSKAEYMRRLREERQVSYQNVTDSNADKIIDKDKIEDKDKDKEPEACDDGLVFSAYENEIGVITPKIAEEIGAWLDDDIPAQWLTDAIMTASRNNKRNWAYVNAIVKRWHAEGKQTFDRQKQNGNGSSYQPTPAPAHERRGGAY